MSTTKIEELEKELISKGVDVEALHVAYVGTESIIGELDDESEGVLMLKDPKRVLRLQQVLDGGIAISYMVTDMDFMTSGLVCVKPNIHYPVFNQPEETKANIYESFIEYFKRKVINKAKEAGILLHPSVNPSPFRK